MVFDKYMLPNPYACRFSSWLLSGLGRKASSQTPFGSYYSCQGPLARGVAFWNVESGLTVVKTGDFGTFLWFISHLWCHTAVGSASGFLYQETVESEWVNRQAN